MTEMLPNSPAAWSARAAYASPLEAVGWTESGQRDRFDAVLAHLDLQAGDRILDFGCGLGAFAARLPTDIVYLGYDTAHDMIARARRENPDRGFTAIYPTGNFDAVVIIGALNLPGGWSKQHTFHTLRHLWDTTQCRVLAASLYAGDDERCIRYTEPELEECGRDLGLNVLVERHRHNDLLMVARRGARL